MEDQLMENKMYWGRSRWHSAGPLQRIGWIFGGIVLAVFLAFIFGYFVMLLWNWIMPTIFGLPEIDYWLAFGIIILARLIFGGFGHGHTHNWHDRRRDRYFQSKFRHGDPRWEKMKKWKYYKSFWEEEGEDAFNRYVERNSGTDEEKPAE